MYLLYAIVPLLFFCLSITEIISQFDGAPMYLNARICTAICFGSFMLSLVLLKYGNVVFYIF